MSILGLGGEDLDFSTWPTSYSLVTTSTYLRSTYSRCSIKTATDTLNPALGIVFPAGTVSSCWYTFQIYPIGASTNLVMVGLGSSGGTGGMAGLYIGSGTVAGRLAVYSNNGTAGNGSSLYEETTGRLTAGSLHRIDVQVTSYDDAVNGNVKVWVDGTSAVDYTGNLHTTSGVTTLDRIVVMGSNSATYYWYVSELIVADEDCRQLSLVGNMTLNSNGTMTWSGSYTAVDEVVTDDSDIVYSNTNATDAKFGHIALPAGQFSVKAVDIAARAQKTSDAAVSKLALGIDNAGSVDVDTGQTVTTSWAPYKRLMNTNPLTSSPFTQQDVDAIKVDLRALT